jgi:uncharacterized membrane protein
MNLRYSAISLIIIFFLMPGVASQEISYDLSITLSGDVAHERLVISINNTEEVALEDFSYELQGDANNIKVYDSLGDLSPTVSHNEGVVISSRFRRPIQSGERDSVSIEFDTKELITINEGNYIFSALFSPPGRWKDFTLRIGLPKGMGLPHAISSGAQTDIAPLPDRTISDGTKTIFEWDVGSVNDFAVFVRYVPFSQTKTPAPETTPPAVEEQSRQFPYILLVALIAIIFGGIYLLRGKGPGKKKTEFMKDDEKQIINLIAENEGIVQKRLVDHTGFSKAKISKIVSELDKREIVRVEKIGRRNKLFLTEEFKKK